MSLTTPAGIISLAQRAIGILGQGQTVSDQDNTDAFDVLNGMLSVWNRRRWLIWHLLDVSCATTGAQSYSIGPGGDFNVPRPDRLEAAFYRQNPGTPGSGFGDFSFGVSAFGDLGTPNNGVDYPLTILDSREDYSDIVLKGLASWPNCIFYDSAFPMGYVYPWPIPPTGLYELHLIIKDTLVQFATLTDTINLPPEYTEALWTNLTIRLGAVYPGVQVTETVQRLAKSSLETIRGANAQVPRMKMPAELMGGARYNIFSDQTYT